MEDYEAYENDESIMIVEKWGQDYRGIVFNKDGDHLRFSTMVMDRDLKLQRLIDRLNLKRVDKNLRLI